MAVTPALAANETSATVSGIAVLVSVRVTNGCRFFYHRLEHPLLMRGHVILSRIYCGKGKL
jgi:hypothetical protein